MTDIQVRAVTFRTSATRATGVFIGHATWEALMYLTSQNFVQVATIFGSGYVPEQRGEETHCNLPWGEKREPIVNFDELLKKLRAALSL